MGIFSCYIVNAVILVSKNVMTGNDSREELPRWLLGRPKRGEKKKLNLENQKLRKVKTPLAIRNKIDYFTIQNKFDFSFHLSSPRRLVVSKNPHCSLSQRLYCPFLTFGFVTTWINCLSLQRDQR